jgi:hypothetical protein
MCFRVDEKLRVRVTDNALSRDLFPTDYYCLGDNENRPIKWLAIESLQHKQFTGASDVVSVEARIRVFSKSELTALRSSLPITVGGVEIRTWM